MSNLKIIEIQELLTRRNQLKDMIVSEKNRLLKKYWESIEEYIISSEMA